MSFFRYVCDNQTHVFSGVEEEVVDVEEVRPPVLPAEVDLHADVGRVGPEGRVPAQRRVVANGQGVDASQSAVEVEVTLISRRAREGIWSGTMYAK